MPFSEDFDLSHVSIVRPQVIGIGLSMRYESGQRYTGIAELTKPHRLPLQQGVDANIAIRNAQRFAQVTHSLPSPSRRDNPLLTNPALITR